MVMVVTGEAVVAVLKKSISGDDGNGGETLALGGIEEGGITGLGV